MLLDAVSKIVGLFLHVGTLTILNFFIIFLGALFSFKMLLQVAGLNLGGEH